MTRPESVPLSALDELRDLLPTCTYRLVTSGEVTGDCDQAAEWVVRVVWACGTRKLKGVHLYCTAHKDRALVTQDVWYHGPCGGAHKPNIIGLELLR